MKDLFKILRFVCGLILFSAGVFIIQASAQRTSKNQADLINLQKSYFEAVVSKNYDYLDGLLAEDYIGGYALGIIDKKRESKDLREFPLKSFEVSEIKTSFPNSSIGIIIFKLHVTVTVNSQDFSEDDVLHCVWTKHGKKWLLASQSAVKVIKNS